MLHPYIPFVTEAAWQHLPRDYESLMITRWPRYSQDDFDEEAEAQMSLLMETIRTIRNIRSEYNVEPGRKIIAHIAAGEHHDVLTRYQEILVSLARLDPIKLQVVPTLDEKPEQAAGQVISGGIEVYLPLAGMIDLAAEKERLEKELTQVEQRLAASQVKLNNQGFVQKAPAEVVEKERERLADLELQADKIREQLKDLG
jgi:valyl-tRNA synthetase